MNFPLLCGYWQDLVDDELRHQVLEEQDSEKDDIWATHPTAKARISHAEQLQDPGVFDDDAPATTLFHNFDEFSEGFSRRWMLETFGVDLSEFRVLNHEEYVRRKELQSQDQDRIHCYLEGSIYPWHPYQMPDNEIAIWTEELLEELSGLLRRWPNEIRPFFSEEWKERRNSYAERNSEISSQRLILQTSLAVASPRYGVLAQNDPEAARVAYKNDVQESKLAARPLEDRAAALADAYGKRISLGMSALRSQPEPEDPDFSFERAAELCRVLRVVYDNREIYHRIHHAHEEVNALLELAGSDALALDDRMKVEEVSFGLRRDLLLVAGTLADVPYPYPTSNGRVSAAEAVVGFIPDGDDIESIRNRSGETREAWIELYADALQSLAGILSRIESGLFPGFYTEKVEK